MPEVYNPMYPTSSRAVGRLEVGRVDPHDHGRGGRVQHMARLQVGAVVRNLIRRERSRALQHHVQRVRALLHVREVHAVGAVLVVVDLDHAHER
eukprot:7257563-Pyramimonas_sp.AAC.1